MATATSSADPREYKVPLALIFGGIIAFAIYGLTIGGFAGVVFGLVLAAVYLILGVPAGIIALFITAKIAGISFGSLGTAILKIAGIFLVVAAISTMIPYIGWLVAIAVYWGFLAWLFELEGRELTVCVVVIWLVRLMISFLTTGLLKSLH